MKLKDLKTADLLQELQRRRAIPDRCETCRKWSITYKRYRGTGWHCDGCNRLVKHCTCRRV